MSTYRAIGLMLLAMLLFAIGDAAIKVLTAHVAIAQVIGISSIIGTVLFAAMAIRSGQALFSRWILHPVVATRNVIEALTSICFVSALANAPLSLVAAIVQAVPLIVTIGAAVILRENVGPRRWAAIGVGLLGVLIMLRPSTDGIELGAIWALLAAFGLASRDVASRMVPKEVQNLQLATWGTVSLLPGAVILGFIGPPLPAISAPHFGVLIVVSVLVAFGYLAITTSTRIGDVSLVAPFRYSRLVFALIIAVLFLSERPDPITLFGAAIVIASGLFVFIRERQTAKET